MNTLSNNTQLIVRLGKDAVVKTIEGSERSVIETSGVWNNTYKNKKGEQVKEEEWYDISIWRKNPSDSFVNLLKKGAEVTINGRVTSEAYLDKQGNPACSMNINVREIHVNKFANEEAAEATTETATTEG